jgi:hypothetical protein
MAVSPQLTAHAPLATSQTAPADQANRGRYRIFLGALRRLSEPALPFQLLELLPGVDLRIVADRTQRTKESRS